MTFALNALDRPDFGIRQKARQIVGQAECRQYTDEGVERRVFASFKTLYAADRCAGFSRYVRLRQISAEADFCYPVPDITQDSFHCFGGRVTMGHIRDLTSKKHQ